MEKPPTLSFFARIRKHFTAKFVILLTAVFFIQEGIIFSMVYLNQLPYYRIEVGINETLYQTYFLFAWSPWNMKSLYGALSDLFPLFGFSKSSYMIISGLFGTSALGILAAVPIGLENSIYAPLLIFFVMTELAIFDLLCEGSYSRIIFVRKIDGDIITWVWLCRILGQLIGGATVGFYVTHFEIRGIFWICFALSFPGIFLVLAGCMNDTYQPNWAYTFSIEKIRNQKELFILSITIGLISIGMMIINTIGNKLVIFLYCAFVSLTLLLMGYLLLPPTLAKVVIYILFQELLYVRIMGALDYWYTSDNSCVPGGPHFDMNFYLTYTQIVGCISGIVGILLFQMFAKNWTFQFAFLFSIIVRIGGSIIDMIIIKRINLKLGISDKAMMILGDSIVMDMAYTLAKMPAVHLTSHLVQPNYECTTFALLAGYHDTGKGISIMLGKILMMLFKIDFDARPCRYENLASLVVFSHMILPLLSIPLVYFLIPNVKVSEVSSLRDEYFRPGRGSDSGVNEKENNLGGDENDNSGGDEKSEKGNEKDNDEEKEEIIDEVEISERVIISDMNIGRFA